jgi:uncharacterized protein (DUF1330 family)
VNSDRSELTGPAITEAGSRFLACHDSPAYQEAMAAQGDGAERDLRIVEGV